jgi:hypothetical protein
VNWSWGRIWPMGREEQRRKAEEGRENQFHEFLERIAKDIHAIREDIHKFLFPAAKSFELTQKGELMGVINGIAPGATEIFDISLLPVGSSLQAGNIPTVTPDNTTDVSIAVAADGLSFSATADAAPVATSFNVVVAGVNSAGAPISTPFNIPLLPATPPPPVPATGFDLNQRGAVAPAAAAKRRI